MNLATLLIACMAFLLITIVLIQNPKGGGIDSTFGGEKANRALGVAQSGSIIEKLTWGLAIVMFLACTTIAAII